MHGGRPVPLVEVGAWNYALVNICALPHIVVLGDPRTNDAYPMRTKLDKWEAHFYSSLANCVLQMLLAAEVLGLSSMYISDVASPYFSVMLKSLLGIPEPLQIYHLLPMGFAKRSPTIHHPRRAIEEILTMSDTTVPIFAGRWSVRTL